MTRDEFPDYDVLPPEGLLQADRIRRARGERSNRQQAPISFQEMDIPDEDPVRKQQRYEE